MNFKIGDFVTRQSYDNDIVFKIINIVDGIAYLKGNYIRLYADSPVSDLTIYKEKEIDTFAEELEEENLDRNGFFYLPARILHIDADCFL